MPNALPAVGASNGTWGTTLNNWLLVAHNADGTLASTATGASSLVASADATTKQKNAADYVCLGTGGAGDDILINAAIQATQTNSLGTKGGSTELTPGVYYLRRPVINNLDGHYVGSPRNRGKSGVVFAPHPSGFTGAAYYIACTTYWDNNTTTAYPAGTPTTTIAFANPVNVTNGQILFIGDGNVGSGTRVQGATNFMGANVTVNGTQTGVTTVTINSWTPAVAWPTGTFVFYCDGLSSQRQMTEGIYVQGGISVAGQGVPAIPTGGYTQGGPAHGFLINSAEFVVNNCYVQRGPAHGFIVSDCSSGAASAGKFDHCEANACAGDGIIVDAVGGACLDSVFVDCFANGNNSCFTQSNYPAGYYTLATAIGNGTSPTSIQLNTPITLPGNSQLVIGSDTWTLSASTRGGGTYFDVNVPVTAHASGATYPAGTAVTVVLRSSLSVAVPNGAVTQLQFIEPVHFSATGIAGGPTTYTIGSDTFTYSGAGAGSNLKIAVTGTATGGTYTVGTGVKIDQNGIYLGRHGMVDHSANNQWRNCHPFFMSGAGVFFDNGGPKYWDGGETETCDNYQIYCSAAKFKILNVDVYANATLHPSGPIQNILVTGCNDFLLENIDNFTGPTPGVGSTNGQCLLLSSSSRRFVIRGFKTENPVSANGCIYIDSTSGFGEIFEPQITGSPVNVVNASIINKGSGVVVHGGFVDRAIQEQSPADYNTYHDINLTTPFALPIAGGPVDGPATVILFGANSRAWNNRGITYPGQNFTSGYVTETYDQQATIAAGQTSIRVFHGLGTFYNVPDATAAASTTVTSAGGSFYPALTVNPFTAADFPVISGTNIGTGVGFGVTLTAAASNGSATVSGAVTVSAGTGGMKVVTHPYTPLIGGFTCQAIVTAGQSPAVAVSAVDSTTVTFAIPATLANNMVIHWSYSPPGT